MILLIDNYDSFTYNLFHYLGDVRPDLETQVVRNDKISLEDIVNLSPSHVVISPGPCTPNEAGISLELIEKYYTAIPILGVCLGHQAIAQALGGRVIRATRPCHGKVSNIFHNNKGIFIGLPQGFEATRYHSLIAEKESLPDCLEITAWTDEGEIMGLAHREYPFLQGVQFHPESILTSVGKQLLSAFLNLGSTQP